MMERCVLSIIVIWTSRCRHALLAYIHTYMQAHMHIYIGVVISSYCISSDEDSIHEGDAECAEYNSDMDEQV